MIAYFRLVVNPNDEEAFKRIINYPARGIGDTTVGKIIAAATENNVSLWAVLCEPLTYGLTINKGTHNKLQDFRGLIEEFISTQSEKNAYEIGTEIIRQSGIINDVCQDTSPENFIREENIKFTVEWDPFPLWRTAVRTVTSSRTRRSLFRKALKDVLLTKEALRTQSSS